MKTGVYVVPGPATLPQAGAGADDGYAYLNQKNASAPVDQSQVPHDVRLQRLLKTLKGKFPAPVATENPFRFRPIPMANGPRPVGSSTPPAADVALQTDPARGPGQLVARRVPGVGAMPYEQYGFSLLPGWNGVETASWPPASQQVAPAGTQWAEQDADPARAGITSYDARHNNAYGARGPSAPPPAPAGAPGLPAQPGRYAAPTRQTPVYGQYPQPMSR
jgi:hypothetical protein